MSTCRKNLWFQLFSFYLFLAICSLINFESTLRRNFFRSKDKNLNRPWNHLEEGR